MNRSIRRGAAIAVLRPVTTLSGAIGGRLPGSVQRSAAPGVRHSL